MFLVREEEIDVNPRKRKKTEGKEKITNKRRESSDRGRLRNEQDSFLWGEFTVLLAFVFYQLYIVATHLRYSEYHAA